MITAWRMRGKRRANSDEGAFYSRVARRVSLYGDRDYSHSGGFAMRETVKVLLEVFALAIPAWLFVMVLIRGIAFLIEVFMQYRVAGKDGKE